AKILLRIDDLDADRKRPEYVDDIFRSIDFLGIDYDIGPASSTDFDANWSQRCRLDLYEDMLNELSDSGTLYACGLSRRALQAYGATYPAEGRQQQLSLDTPNVAWRFRADGDGAADFVVRRRDELPAYQTASLTDDHFFGVTHLIRGQDLLESTDRQRQLAVALGWPDFLEAHVWHHPVLLSGEGRKLSKSAGDGFIAETSIRAMRERSNVPVEVFRQVARLLNAPFEVEYSLKDLQLWGVQDGLFRPVQTVKLS
ncbi:MAG: glutamate--tRNA ligase, partial [Cytophagaceae bacterium]